MIKQSDQIIDHAEQQCKSHGVRLTDKRKQVLMSLLQSERALSAYEIIDFCKAQFGQSLPPMSVYRILDFLAEEQLVHKLSLANKYVACSHIACDHAHRIPQFLICGECKKVEEVSIDQSVVHALQNNVKGAGFKLASEQIEIDCVCDSCAPV